jgi:hypothetical protein
LSVSLGCSPRHVADVQEHAERVVAQQSHDGRLRVAVAVQTLADLLQLGQGAAAVSLVTINLSIPLMVRSVVVG